MKAMLECAVLLGLTVCLSDNADAQVRQSGNVTPTHVACFTSSGVIQDCGAATSPYPTTFGVVNGSGTGICVNSDKPTAAGYQQACLGATTSGGAVLSVQKFGTAPTGGFQFLLNGATQAIPTVTLPVTNGDNACFSGTSGTLIDCGGAFGGFANPTASIGLAVVNGSATTALPSDAAPPLSQAIAPSWTNRHIWALTPTYDQASGALGTGLFVPLDAASHSVGAGLQFNHIGIRQPGGGFNQFTVGAGGIAEGYSVFMESLTGSDATSNLYGVVSSTQNDGPGTVKSVHASAAATGPSTGVTITGSFGVTPVATSSTGSVAVDAVLVSATGVHDIATAVSIRSTGDRLLYGVGNAIAAVPISTAFYQAWMATGSSANARAFQVLNNTGTELGFISKTGTFQSGLAGTQTGSMVFAGATSGSGTVTAQAAAGTSATWTLPNASGTFAISASSPLSLSATTGALTCATCVTSAAALTANQLVIGSGSQGEQALGALGTTTTLLHGNAGGAPTFAAVVSADLNITTTTCTNQFLTAISATGTGTCTTATLAGAQYANQGTTTTVLHGNAAGNPSFAAVSLTADITGTLGVANGGTGAATFTSNGVLYGNGTGAVQATAQGAANTVLIANAGAPSFSAAITVGTSVASPTVTGGTASNGIDITTGSITRNNVAGNIALISGTNAHAQISYQTAGQAAQVWIDGHVLTNNFGAPALTSCGTSPTIDASSSDEAGLVTMGTTATGCVITFKNAYTSAPYCTVTWQATPLASQSYVLSNTAITITQTSTSNDKINYVCRGQSGG